METPSLEKTDAADSASVGNALKALLGEANALSIAIKQVARSVRGHGDLPIGAPAVLEILTECGQKTVPQIARLRETSRQNIQILINRLQRAGIVALKPNPAHKRSALIQLTERGKAFVAQPSPAAAELMKDLEAGSDPAEILKASSLLHEIRGRIRQRAKAAAGHSKSDRETQSARKHERPTPHATESSSADQPEESQDPGELPVKLL